MGSSTRWAARSRTFARLASDSRWRTTPNAAASSVPSTTACSSGWSASPRTSSSRPDPSMRTPAGAKRLLAEDGTRRATGARGDAEARARDLSATVGGGRSGDCAALGGDGRERPGPDRRRAGRRLSARDRRRRLLLLRRCPRARSGGHAGDDPGRRRGRGTHLRHRDGWQAGCGTATHPRSGRGARRATDRRGIGRADPEWTDPCRFREEASRSRPGRGSRP